MQVSIENYLVETLSQWLCYYAINLASEEKKFYDLQVFLHFCVTWR